MLRKWTVPMGTLALTVAIGTAGLGHAQNPTPGGGPHTRIALINLAQVFKSYNKVSAFTNDNKRMLQPYQDKAKHIQTQIQLHNAELEKRELAEARRIELEKNRTTYQRNLEDLQVEAKLMFTKKNEEQMLIVYKEVMETATGYAKSNGYEVVMHYNDVPNDSSDFYSAGNVSRKIQAGACIPMYLAPGIDITTAVTTLLNTAYGPNSTVQPAPGGR